MKMSPLKRTLFGVSAAVLIVIGVRYWRQERSFRTASGDTPPTIAFTSNGDDGPVSLRNFIGRLTMDDDNGLDFKTYRLRILEADKALDLPIEGMVGKHYESPVYLGLLLDNPVLEGKSKLTLEFSISDDKGQEATLTREIRLK